MGTERTYLNIIKAIFNKSVATVTLSREKLKAFSLRSGTIRECLFSLNIILNIVLEAPATAIKQNNKIKYI